MLFKNTTSNLWMSSDILAAGMNMPPPPYQTYSRCSFSININSIDTEIYVAIVFCSEFGGWGESVVKLLLKVHQYLRLHYISPSNLRSLLLLLSLQLRDLCPYASKQGLIRPSPPRSRRDQSDHYFLNMVNPRAYC